MWNIFFYGSFYDIITLRDISSEIHLIWKSIMGWFPSTKKCVLKYPHHHLKMGQDLVIVPLHMEMHWGYTEVEWEPCFNTNDLYSYANREILTDAIPCDRTLSGYGDSDKCQAIPKDANKHQMWKNVKKHIDFRVTITT